MDNWLREVNDIQYILNLRDNEGVCCFSRQLTIRSTVEKQLVTGSFVCTKLVYNFYKWLDFYFWRSFSSTCQAGMEDLLRFLHGCMWGKLTRRQSQGRHFSTSAEYSHLTDSCPSQWAVTCIERNDNFFSVGNSNPAIYHFTKDVN